MCNFGFCFKSIKQIVLIFYFLSFIYLRKFIWRDFEFYSQVKRKTFSIVQMHISIYFSIQTIDFNE